MNEHQIHPVSKRSIWWQDTGGQIKEEGGRDKQRRAGKFAVRLPTTIYLEGGFKE